MKGLLALLFLALLGLNAYNYWEIRTLREEIATMQRKMDERETSATDAVVAKAMATLMQAREAVAHTDMSRARAMFDTARQQLDEAAKTASTKSAPAVKWLRDEASDLGKQIQSRVGSH